MTELEKKKVQSYELLKKISLKNGEIRQLQVQLNQVEQEIGGLEKQDKAVK